MLRRLTDYSDAMCGFCGNPAAGGLADSQGLWCKDCGRIRAVMAFETMAFELLRAYPQDFDAAIDGVRAYDGTPNLQHSTKLAGLWRPLKNMRVWETA